MREEERHGAISTLEAVDLQRAAMRGKERRAALLALEQRERPALFTDGAAMR